MNELINQMSADEIMAKVAEAKLTEYGVYKDEVASKWKGQYTGVVTALNNADIDKALLGILKEYPKRVFDGMDAAAKVLGVDCKILYIPDGEDELAKSLKEDADARDIKIRTGIVNVREDAGCIFHHIETMYELSNLLEGGYEPGYFMAVKKGNDILDIRKVSYGTAYKDIVGEGEVKAVRIGTKIYDPQILEQTIDAKSEVGNGVITVFGKGSCIIDECEKILRAQRRQSCGKCNFCREGLIQLHTMMEEITKGQGKKEFIDMLSEISEAMVFSTPCSMGQTASDIVLGTLEYFSSEYDDHIKKKKCAAGVCKSFMAIYIDPNTCTGCEECADVCPADAIEGKAGFIHMIDEFECTKCGKCISACDEEAVIQTTGRIPKLPNRLTKVGKFKKRH